MSWGGARIDLDSTIATHNYGRGKSGLRHTLLDLSIIVKGFIWANLTTVLSSVHMTLLIYVTLSDPSSSSSR